MSDELGDDEEEYGEVLSDGERPIAGLALVQDFPLKEHNAKTRRWLAFMTLGVMSVLYLLGSCALVFGLIDSETLERLAVVVSPVQALAASVLGFYFGQEHSRRD